MINLQSFTKQLRVFSFALFLLSFCSVAQAKRNDVVIMNNGDHFTGEVKRLQNGLLYIDTEYVSSNIGLDWNQVQSVQSTATYRIVLNNGQRLIGKIEKAPRIEGKTTDFMIREADEEKEVPSAVVVSIDTSKPTFWRQLTGSVDLGYSFTSGSKQSTFNIDSGTTYQTPKWKASVAFNSTIATQTGAVNTNREDLQPTVARFLNRNSFLLAYSDFLHNTQQDLDLRTTAGGAYGRFLKRTAATSLSWMGGIVYTHETFDTESSRPSDQNMEAVAGLEYHMVRFNFGEFDSELLIFPGLTDAGRVRATFNNSLTIKLRNNFHLSFNLWDNFDSRPPVASKKNDLGLSSGIGWSY